MLSLRQGLVRIVVTATVCLVAVVGAAGGPPAWVSPNRCRLLLNVDGHGVSRTNSPAAVDVDFAAVLAENGIEGRFDEDTIEVVAYGLEGEPKAVKGGAAKGGDVKGGAAKGDSPIFAERKLGQSPRKLGQSPRRYLLPWRVQRYYPGEMVTLSFVVPDETCTTFAVYFDTVESGLGKPRRYRGLVGDGDFFRVAYGRREIAAGHFDAFGDLDGDGDLDLFRGGVEPFIYCYENPGGNRLVDRGRLTSGGELLTLPNNPGNHRSWVVPHFYDWDGDGDEDFLPSFMDGPYAGKIVFFENTTTPGGRLTFVDQGVLNTVSGTPLAGGEQAGGWFPSIVFVVDFDGDGDGRADLLLGNNDHCYLYRNLGPDGSGGWRLDEAVALRAGGEEIELFNPCFEVADLDSDGDWDLLAAPQAGQIYWYENVDTTAGRTNPTFAKGAIIAYDERYLQRSTHPRVKAYDFTGDGLLDLAIDRAWELCDLDHLSNERDYGTLLKNVGTATAPRWEAVDADHGALYTQQFQICDAVRQNVVRAVDWDHDGRTDLLAGDCDGFIWHFQNRTNQRFAVFAPGERLTAGGEPLSLAGSLGHARPDVCDWNNDGRKDLVVSDGAGTVNVYLNEGTDAAPMLGRGQEVVAYDARGKLRPIDRGTRSHVTVCDYNHDGKKDLIFSDQQNPGFYFFENVATDAEPRFSPARSIGLTPYVRPNLGSLVDWDGDGRQDLIACEFEHSIRFYQNVGSGQPGTTPEFAEAAGVTIVKPYSIMMISGADVVDWNRDGDLDVLTGQGHGGSGIRFYERDYIEDGLRGTRPKVTVERFERARR